jgi:hypothetical protein
MRGVVVPRIRAVAATVVLAIALASCGGSGSNAGSTPSPGPTGSAAPIARPSSPARLTIVSPENGEVVQGSTVELLVDLQDARIVPQTTTDVAPDEGHLHVLLDDTLISMTEGLEQTIPDVAPGLHRLTVEFVAADHAPFDPRVVEVVAFEMTA